MAISLLCFFVVLGLGAYHRLRALGDGAERRHPDSGLAGMLLLALTLASGVCVTVVESTSAWRDLALALQIAMAGAAVALHIRLATVAAWIDEKAAKADAWRPRKGRRE